MSTHWSRSEFLQTKEQRINTIGEATGANCSNTYAFRDWGSVSLCGRGSRPGVPTFRSEQGHARPRLDIWGFTGGR